MTENREILNMMCEDKPIWRDIEGHDGTYQVNQYGEVRSWKEKVGRKWHRADTPHLKAQNKDKDGYHRVSIYTNKRIKGYRIHRLVAEAFLPQEDKGRCWVDHIDGDVSNNCCNNVRWVSPIENQYNARINVCNKSGVKGVSFRKRDNVWLSCWQEDGRTLQRTFKTKEEAIEHRRQMVELHYSSEHYIEDR